MNGTNGKSNNTKIGKRAGRKSARHGARNQHRHKHFTKLILETFPHILEQCAYKEDGDETNDANSENSKITTRPMHVLDVAGGKGELSARLSLCHSLRVVMVDPRRADIASVYENTVVPKLPKKWKASVEKNLKDNPRFLEDELEKKFSQMVLCFSEPLDPTFDNVQTDKLVVECDDSNSLKDAVKNASLIIGLHADGATEDIVDAAIRYNKPFVVVPCCVFPNFFRERFVNIPIGGSEISNLGSDGEMKRVQVRTHEQFCKYLLEKDPRFRMEILPFEGRNVAIFMRPPDQSN
ncbi:hypothetical protein ACHAXS_007852 [Conticribra weissflogii]